MEWEEVRLVNYVPNQLNLEGLVCLDGNAILVYTTHNQY